MRTSEKESTGCVYLMIDNNHGTDSVISPTIRTRDIATDKKPILWEFVLRFQGLVLHNRRKTFDEPLYAFQVDPTPKHVLNDPRETFEQGFHLIFPIT